MIKIEYHKESQTIVKHIKGDSVLLLFELNVLIEDLLETYHKHGQETLVLDEITDVISKFAEKHTPKTKGDKKDD